MSFTSLFPSPGEGLLNTQFLPLYFILGVILVVSRLLSDRHSHRFPEINLKKSFEFSAQARVQDFIARSKDILSAGRTRYPNQPYRVYTDLGEVFVLPSSFVDELRSHPSLDFENIARDDSHAYISGFEPFEGNERLKYVVIKYLTKALTKLTAPISDEATHALRRVLTDSEEWHEIDPRADVIKVVSQMSSRVFMGEELCRNEDWVKVVGEYTVQAFRLGATLRSWPRWSRPIIHWFMPECWELRSRLDKARRLLRPHLEKRQALKEEALARGQSMTFDDSIEWFEKEYEQGYDPATNQITLSLVAIHTTSDLLTQVMLDIAQHPELVEPLRQEIVQVLGTQGLKKTALYNLKLMDSVIKETQRMKPIGITLFRRQVLADIELSDGTKLYKGDKFVVDAIHLGGSEYYEDADKFNGYRFLELRDKADEARYAQLVSTSSKHIGFGHGQHACPGRFFAANEIKIALCHLLLKYDWKLPEGTNPKPITYGTSFLPDPTAKLFLRRRKADFDIDSLKC